MENADDAKDKNSLELVQKSNGVAKLPRHQRLNLFDQLEKR